MQYSFERVSDILHKMVEHLFKDCIISFKGIDVVVLWTSFALKESLWMDAALFWCVLYA